MLIKSHNRLCCYFKLKLTPSDFRFFTKAFHSNPFRVFFLNLAQPLNLATKLIFGFLLFIFIKRCYNMEVKCDRPCVFDRIDLCPCLFLLAWTEQMFTMLKISKFSFLTRLPCSRGPGTNSLDASSTSSRKLPPRVGVSHANRPTFDKTAG